jgi:primosomal protein N'
MRKSEYNNFSKSGAFCSSAPQERRSLSYPPFKNGFFYAFLSRKEKSAKKEITLDHLRTVIKDYFSVLLNFNFISGPLFRIITC